MGIILIAGTSTKMQNERSTYQSKPVWKYCQFVISSLIESPFHKNFSRL